MGIIGTPLGYVMYAIESVVHNYGISLVIFIILTKVLLFPLAIKQQKSTVKMASMSKKQAELQKRYGKDKQKMNEELMKLYEQEGYNPMSGCLPMIIQMLLLFGIVDVIYKPLKHLLHVSGDLITQATAILTEASGAVSTAEIAIISAIQSGSTAYDGVFGAELVQRIRDFNMNFLGVYMGDIPQWNNILVLIPIISGLTALASTIISMKIQARNGQPAMQGGMKITMYAMPLLSVWIGFSMPAGAGIYWILSNITMIAQQIIVQIIWSPAKLATMQDKNSEKTREKMRKKRERMEEYNKLLEEKGMAPKPVPKKLEAEVSTKTIDREELEREREAANRKLAEARRRMAEKYGDSYNENEQ